MHTFNATEEMIKNSLSEFGEDIEITECQDGQAKGRNFVIRINTDDPTMIFDICAQFGRIKSVRVKEC